MLTHIAPGGALSMDPRFLRGRRCNEMIGVCGGAEPQAYIADGSKNSPLMVFAEEAIGGAGVCAYAVVPAFCGDDVATK